MGKSDLQLVGTTLRVADVDRAAAWHKKWFGATEVGRVKRATNESAYLAIPREGAAAAGPFESDGQCFVEVLREADCSADFRPSDGNAAAELGFGHLAYHAASTAEHCKPMVDGGVEFVSKPGELAPGVAFAKDADGYWVEVLQHSDRGNRLVKEKLHYGHTSIRVTDVEKSREFYRSLGMQHIMQVQVGEMRLSGMHSCQADAFPDVPYDNAIGDSMIQCLFDMTLELQSHVAGTEQHRERYLSGNSSPKGFVGLTFVAADLPAAVERLAAGGMKFKTLVGTEAKPAVAAATDLDGYLITFVQQGTPAVEVDCCAAAAAVA